LPPCFDQFVDLVRHLANVLAHLDDVAPEFLILRLIHLRLPRGRSFNNRDALLDFAPPRKNCSRQRERGDDVREVYLFVEVPRAVG